MSDGPRGATSRPTSTSSPAVGCGSTTWSPTSSRSTTPTRPTHVIASDPQALAVQFCLLRHRPRCAETVQLSRPPPVGVAPGIIGAGNYAKMTFLPAMKKAGFGRRRRGHLERRAQRPPPRRAPRHRPSWPPTWRRCLPCDDVDTVFVLSRHDSHADWTARALRPASTSSWRSRWRSRDDELDTVVDARTTSGRSCGPASTAGTAECVTRAEQALGAHGGPLVLTYRVNAGRLPDTHWYKDRRQGGRLLGEVCHFIDLASWIVGQARRRGCAPSGPARPRPLLEEDLVVSPAVSRTGPSRRSPTPSSARRHLEGATRGARPRTLGRHRRLPRLVVDGKDVKLSEPGKGHVENLRRSRRPWRGGVTADAGPPGRHRRAPLPRWLPSSPSRPRPRVSVGLARPEPRPTDESRLPSLGAWRRDLRALGSSAPLRAAYEASKRTGFHRWCSGSCRRPRTGRGRPASAWPTRHSRRAGRCLDDAAAILGEGVRVFGHRAPTGVSAPWHQAPVTGEAWPAADRGGGSTSAPTDRLVRREVGLGGRASSRPGGARAGGRGSSRRARWLDGLVRLLQRWCDECRPERGVNWYSSLELALRAIAWAQVLALCGERLPEQLRDGLDDQLVASARHIMMELPYTVSSMKNNHMLGDGLGLVLLGRMFPTHPGARRWQRVGDWLFHKQLRRHMRPDGSMIEDSLSYHRFVLEMLAVRVLLGDVGPRSARQPCETPVDISSGSGCSRGRYRSTATGTRGGCSRTRRPPDRVAGAALLARALSGDPVPAVGVARPRRTRLVRRSPPGAAVPDAPVVTDDPEDPDSRRTGPASSRSSRKARGGCGSRSPAARPTGTPTSRLCGCGATTSG